MRKLWKWTAFLLTLVLLLSIGFSVLAEESAEDVTDIVVEEPAEDSTSYYENYVAIGDSCGAGVGLPAYLERVKETGNRWIAAERVEGSYPDLVGKAVNASKVDQIHFPGARTADIRYLLDDTYKADWVLTGQAAYLSDGVVSKENLDAHREATIAAIKDADLITLDVGINDVWLPVIAAIYDIAGQGRIAGRNLTVPELVQRYGSVGALATNAASFVRAWIFNPFLWPSYILKMTNALAKWALDYQVNVGAILNKIYQLNPNAKVVVCGLYNPVNGWDILPFANDNLIQKVLQPYYSLLNLRKKTAVLTYRGDAVYVNMTNVELISDHFTIPLFEFTTVNDTFGFNPHPTAAGAETQATNILDKLGIPAVW